MDLTLTPELAVFRDEVGAFLRAHEGEHEAGVPKDPKGWQIGRASCRERV